MIREFEELKTELEELKAEKEELKVEQQVLEANLCEIVAQKFEELKKELEELKDAKEELKVEQKVLEARIVQLVQSTPFPESFSMNPECPKLMVYDDEIEEEVTEGEFKHYLIDVSMEIIESEKVEEENNESVEDKVEIMENSLGEEHVHDETIEFTLDETFDVLCLEKTTFWDECAIEEKPLMTPVEKVYYLWKRERWSLLSPGYY